MIFLVVFGFIALVVIILNVMDNSNLQTIENYFKSKNCQNIIYSKGSYKGVCDDEVMEISNSFNVDLEKNKTIYKLNEIKNIEKNNMAIIINNSYTIRFKEKKNMDKFYKSLKEKIN